MRRRTIRSPSRAHAIAVAAVTAVAGFASTASAGPPPQCGSFGMNPGDPVNTDTGAVLLDDDFARLMRATGASWVRMEFVRAKGGAQVDLKTYDPIVTTTLKTSSLKAIGLLSPRLVDGTQKDWNVPLDASGQNPFVRRFVAEAERIIAHYNAEGMYWEVWNEPNETAACIPLLDPSCDPGNAGGTYVRPEILASILHQLHRFTDPNLITYRPNLVVGGLFAHNIGGDEGENSMATNYLEALYAQADLLKARLGETSYPWEGLAYHPYLDQTTAPVAPCADDYVRYLDEIKARREAHGDTSGLWITEFGWATRPSGTPDANGKIWTRQELEAIQSTSLLRTVGLLTGRTEVRAAFLFKMMDSPGTTPEQNNQFGLYTFDPKLKPDRAKPAYGLLTQLAAAATPYCTQIALGCDRSDPANVEVDPAPDPFPEPSPDPGPSPFAGAAVTPKSGCAIGTGDAGDALGAAALAFVVLATGRRKRRSG